MNYSVINFSTDVEKLYYICAKDLTYMESFMTTVQKIISYWFVFAGHVRNFGSGRRRVADMNFVAFGYRICRVNDYLC